MKVTYFGTTVLLFDDGHDQVLFDAHLTRPDFNAVFFDKIATDTAVVDDILSRFGVDRLRAIFVSHTHYDHALDAAYIAVKCGATLYGTPSCQNVGLGGGVSLNHLVCFDKKQSYTIGDFTVTVLPSIHSKAHFYNNDLGKVIDKPLLQPCKKAEFKEGGSYDFLVEHSGKRYLIRPSYGFIQGQLADVRADVLFLGVGGLSKADEKERETFFAETVDMCGAEKVVPVHWDNFFVPFTKPVQVTVSVVERTEISFSHLAAHCQAAGKEFVVQWPLTTLYY